MSYSCFARFYDSLMSDTDYDAIAQRYLLLAEKCGITGGTLADLGCGTGEMCGRFVRRGFDVIGVDISEDMLSRAAAKENGAQYVCQDIARLDLGCEVDIIASSLDCLDHLGGEEEVRKTFERAASSLRKGGAFIFDVNTIYKHREVLGSNAFVFENDEVFCVWQNFYNEEDNSVDISLDFFVNTQGGSYERYCEDFTERAYPLANIEKWLEQAGFEVVGVYDGLTERRADENCERALFLAVRK